MTDRILLVEDDVPLGRQVAGQLRSAGFDPKWITDGAAALHEPPASYALIILDLMLPGEDGLAVLKHIRESGSHVPVLLTWSTRMIDLPHHLQCPGSVNLTV